MARSLSNRYIFPHLTSQQRRRLRRRSERQARRMFAPDIQAARAGVRAVKRQRRRELQSVTGATRALQGGISNALGDLKGSGLSQNIRHQIAHELTSRSADAAAAAPLLKADVRQSYIEPLATARGELATEKVNRAHKATETLASLLEKARTQSRTAAKERASERGGGTKGELRDAMKVAILKYQQGPSDGKWKPPYTNKRDWSNFVAAILGSEGVTDPHVAAEAAREAMYRVLNREGGRTGREKVSREFFDRWLRAQLEE